ncbi:hypothetical protein [Verrucosispora sp. WMMC514]|uniref:hypothetical protein n=1 Tax=Verrucosispora sp. WMMC514 TaxID=3015156 RepID=UPI00248C07B7|nr:hypothetical protein [Verrucosispora sp. WMMC514]WBB94149.1 hypothetical protein O7597_14970 [Verrucosispora sp. WMMC514]
MTTLTWANTQPGVWRSLCGRYAIVSVTLPERPARTVYQARRIDPSMAAADPMRGTLGYLLEESPWRWNSDNSVHSAEAACDRHAWQVEHPLNVPTDHPAAALSRFWWPSGGGRGAIALIWEEAHLIAQVIGMGRAADDGVEVGEYTRIDLTALGVHADRATLPTRTDHPEQCGGCNVPAGTPHAARCDHARCLATGGQRLQCELFGESKTAGIEAVRTGGTSQQEFDDYFKTPLEHDCGQDIYRG